MRKNIYTLDHLHHFFVNSSIETKIVILPEYLAQRLPKLQELCLEYHMKSLWAIGSVLTDKFHDASDVDLVYELDEPAISDKEYLPNIDGFIAGILDLFKGRKIDLIHYPSLKNPYFIEEVDETKVLLYDQNAEEIFV